MVRNHAVVIGGGVGGLTAAAALHRSGWQVTVLERARSLEPVGSAISLAPNSQRALDVIGLGDTIRSLAAWQGEGGLRSSGGRWLSRTDSAAAAERFGGELVLLHRATLIGILAAELPPSALRTGCPAELVSPGSPGGRRAVVRTPSGDIEADLVVGADGIRSAVRGTLFPRHPGPSYAGFTTWRAVVPGLGRPFAPHESWGRGALWGTQPLKDGRVYAYAGAVTPAGGRAADDEKAELLRRFGDWHDPVPAVLAATEPGRILRHDVHHMAEPLPSFHRGRAVLVGDAAHAMAPMLGQGGNQAIEDAVVLAHHVAPGPGLGEGLAAYSAVRLPRTTAVVRKSARVARVVAWSGAPAVALRDALLATVTRLGPGLALRALDGIADWQPPQRTYAAEPKTRT
ncbi:FAD-dependent monooxygenase [Streptomyces fulvorobeus]|uniref:2-polyprenyl-6-methoxyphenol hydroxylase-like FAD-dependent oxidoreductase n=1 Tax=Streptomyces fulvorobeus TaxID=284028 RepID=A0A7J0C1P0_9ACTN|nr:FAD-dependent monooxygenase [Streptomyces fulvorobeus]NYE39612.1 2-polyprenyl-6-methoxyphenol hydroxylase-like FAD-dependent oxidoreductase [Streptomyces fulvorobeus]GFM95853.1 monooxygenase [Streptomyces fulvorobeus]